MEIKCAFGEAKSYSEKSKLRSSFYVQKKLVKKNEKLKVILTEAGEDSEEELLLYRRRRLGMVE